MKIKKRKNLLIKIMLCLLCLLVQTTNAKEIKEIDITNTRISTVEKNTRVVFDMSTTTPFSAFILTNPTRLVLDLPHTTLKANLNGLNFVHSPIRSVRVNINHRNAVRIVFDLKSKITYHIFWLKDERGSARLVLDLQPDLQNRMKADEPIQSQVALSIADFAKRQRDIIIVIDPGHGGKDPGAIGARGVREKDVVLAISYYLQKYLNTIPGMRAILTRKNDYFIPLRGRLNLARKDKADFFVAIHADSFYYKYARGASVFALSQRAATSESARWLAEKENYSELGGVSLTNKSYMLRSVLIDLSQTATISQSLQVGRAILNALDNITLLHHYRVEQAPFMVLKSPDIPSLLIETGFITNPYEERNLRSPRYQKKLAQSIASGIITYFRHHPPAGTQFAAWKNAHTYAVND